MANEQTRFQRYMTEHMTQLRAPGEWRGRVKDRLRHRYARYLPVDLHAPILEIGPGFGEFMDLLIADLGYRNVRGIDLSPEVAEYCNRLFPGSVTVVEDTATYLQAHRGQFSTVVMFHVIEHVSKPQAIPLLSAIRASFAPGGVLLLETPNMANPFLGLTFRYADFTHEVGYTETSIHYVLQAAGFWQISIFEATLPANHWARLAQRVGQQAVKGLVQLIYAFYGYRIFRFSRVVSPELCVAAR